MKKGQFCTVNKRDEGQVYFIESIKNMTAHLLYVEGKNVCKTSIDIDCLRKPTPAQLNHEYNQDTVEQLRQ